MVGLGMILGGALKGGGDARLDELKAQAKAKQEEAAAELQFERQRRLAAEGRDFTAEQNALTREQNAAQHKEEMDYKRSSLDAEIGFKERDAALKEQEAGDLHTGADGNTYRIRGGTAETVKGPDGEPMKLAGTSKDKPADVATAEWLIQQGVAKDASEAYKLIKEGVKANPTGADIEKMVEAATKTELEGRFGVKPEEVNATRERNRQRILSNLGMAETKPAAGAQRPTGMTDEQVISEAKKAIQKGANKEAVLNRLREMGIDTSGL